MRRTKQTRMPIVIVPSVPSRGGSLRHASTLGNAEPVNDFETPAIAIY